MATIPGTDGNDTLTGTAEDDVITGLAGDDSLSGLDGNDSIDGGTGLDTIDGGTGNDSIDDTAGGASSVTGGAGDDQITTGGTDDWIDGGTDNDSIAAQTGDDTVLGGDGNDTIYGNAFSGGVPASDMDSIDGGAGDDFIYGGKITDEDGELDQDTLAGADGNDTIFGLDGADSIAGDGGDDSLDGGLSNDTLTGGEGNDIFTWTAGNGSDTITDFGVDSGETTDGDSTNNDYVDLTGIFNDGTLAAYNAANGTSFDTPMQALNDDLADGVVGFNGTDMAGPTLTMTGVTGGLRTEQTGVACFTAGTLIEVEDSVKPVEELAEGDMVRTLDGGFQPLRWIAETRRDSIDLAMNPKLKPVRIPAGALGGGLPARDLLVSRQHRVLVRSKIARRMFDADEILLPAIKLVGLNGIEIAEVAEVTYFHMLFDRHQIVFSEGAPTESLFTGPMALQSVPAEARREIETLFPQLLDEGFVAEAARPLPGNGRQIRQLVERHRKSNMPLLAG